MGKVDMEPCKGCGDRAEGCHGRCERYAAFKEENRKRKAWLRRENEGKVMPAIRYDATMKKWMNPPRGINRRVKMKGSKINE